MSEASTTTTTQTGQTGQTKPDEPAQVGQSVDIQAEIQKALAAQQIEFQKQFKAATGHDSLADFQTSEAKRKGESDKLLDKRNAELAQVRAELAQAHIQTAILTAATDAVDPTIVHALLSCRAKYENGAVTVDGKSPMEAVKALLAEKPFLAKAGPSGSGSPQTGGGGSKIMTRTAFDALAPKARSDFLKNSGTVTD
jgi:hypothetical protein